MCFAPLFVAALVPLPPLAVKPAYGPPSAALHKDQLLVAVMKTLYGGPFAPARPEVDRPRRYWNWNTYESPSYFKYNTTEQAKLDVRGDRFLICEPGGPQGIFALADLPLLEMTKDAEKLCQQRGYENQRGFTLTFSNPGSYTYLLFPPSRKPDVPRPPGPAEGNFSFRPTPELWYAFNGRYDVQIAGPRTVRLFHAHKGTLLVSVEPDYLNTWFPENVDDRVQKKLKASDRELRTGDLPADFTEKFVAHTAGKRDYLVTDRGRVYMVAPKGKDELDITAIWTDPAQKIRGVVQDPENDAVYGWGTVAGLGLPLRFYVKLDPKPVAVPSTRTVPLWNDRSDAYLESYECARAFRKAAEKK